MYQLIFETFIGLRFFGSLIPVTSRKAIFRSPKKKDFVEDFFSTFGFSFRLFFNFGIASNAELHLAFVFCLCENTS